MATRFTVTADSDASVDWPSDELAAGVFRHMVHRVRPEAHTIRFDGLTYSVADCGAIAVPTDEPRTEWPMCRQCC
jgi:hypothetical protein